MAVPLQCLRSPRTVRPRLCPKRGNLTGIEEMKISPSVFSSPEAVSHKTERIFPSFTSIFLTLQFIFTVPPSFFTSSATLSQSWPSSEFRIPVLLYKRGFDVFVVLFAAEGLFEHILYYRTDGYTLYPLSSPVGRYLPRVAAPKLFGVSFKKHPVEHPAEAVYVKVFERILFSFMYRRTNIAESGLGGS